MLLFYPILNILLTAGYLTLWLYVALYLACCGEITVEAVYGYSEWRYSEETTGAFLYWLFGLCWILEFTVAVGFTCVAFCFAIWFLTKEEPSKGQQRALPERMLFKVVCVTLTKFAGTIALGSLFISLIQALHTGFRP